MSDIFISYASEDQPRAKIIAEALKHQGYSVWWDKIIPPGKKFDKVIKEKLDSTKCIIVLWSWKSVLSDWVIEESSVGANREILIPVLIDDVEIPLGFKLIHAANLVDWSGTLPNPEFDLILKSVTGLVRQKKVNARKPPPRDKILIIIGKIFKFEYIIFMIIIFSSVFVALNVMSVIGPFIPTASGPTIIATPTPTITATAALPPQLVGCWQKIDDFPLQVNTIVSDPTNLQVLYAGSKGGVYKSEDTGITWQLITQETLGDEAMALALTCDVLPILYADVHGEIFASTDGAKSWNYMGDTKFRSGFWHHLIVAPSDQNVLFNIAIPGGVALSSDGGSNWQSVYKGLPNEENSAFALSLVIDPIDKNVVYMGTGEWVYGGSGYGVYKSKDGGETWSPANLGIENYRIIALAIDPSEPQILYASEGGGKLFKSTDGGQNWKDITDKLPIQDNSNPSIKEIVVDPAASKTLYLLREQFGVLVSNDGGVNWHIIGKPPVESKYNAFTMAINFDQHPVLILGVEGDGGWRYITEG